MKCHIAPLLRLPKTNRAGENTGEHTLKCLQENQSSTLSAGMRFVDGRPCRDRDTHQAAIHRRVQKKTVAEQSNMGNKIEALCERDVPKAGCDVVEMATAPPNTHIEPLRTCPAARDIES